MQNERTREVMLSFFVWMLAGFIIRVCLACSCGRPQHAVGFHYAVYSYIVFVLLLHRTWRRKQLLLVSSGKWMVKAEAEARFQVRISDFVISIIQCAIFLLIKNTFNTNLVEA